VSDHDDGSALDISALRRYLERSLPGGVDGELTAQLLAGGRSNPTYEVTDRTRSWVLRRPPFGSVLPTAHDMGREYRVLTALASSAVPVPAPVTMCADPDVIGAPFYVMEKIEGTTLQTVEDTAALTPQQRDGLSASMIEILAILHEVNVAEVGLSDWGRPAGYLERQVRRWRRQWQASATVERPEVDELLERLEYSLPRTVHSGIVHGDFKLDNLMVDPGDPTRVLGLLDWEMATLGDTATDLGVLLSFWDRPEEPFHPLTDGMTALDGFWTRERLIERYAKLRGIEPPDVGWYLVFADVKIAVIFEGIHARHLRGETVGSGFEGIGDMVGMLIDRALELAATAVPPRTVEGPASGSDLEEA
jgi:aminoglycoside phosphotransferase (APT) family kinase protein